MDTETGFTGESMAVSVICQELSAVRKAIYTPRNELTLDNVSSLSSNVTVDKLYIEQVDAFDGYGPLRFIVCSAYAKGGQRTEIVSDGFVTTGISGNFSNTVLNKKCLMVKDGYVFCLLTFKKFGTDGSTLEQAFDITGMPTDVDVAVPVIYSNGIINTKGHPLAIGRISGGHFTCTNSGSGSFTANDGTFLHFFAVRDL